MRFWAVQGKKASRLVSRTAIAVLIASAPALVIPALTSPAQAQVSTSFSRIDVSGNRRIEAATIRSIANVPTGRRVSPAELNASLQALFASGLFQDVEFIPSGGRLTIKVVENPTINIVNFEGNKELEDDALALLIELRPRRAYNRAAAEADALRIVEAYRASGRYSAEVRPVIIEREDNRVDLVFEIREGKVTSVDRISFVGNRKYSDSRLRRAVETAESGVFGFLTSNDSFDRDRVALDQQLLREFYLDRGFVDFRVRSVVSELSPQRDGFFVSFNISEGSQYNFGDVSVVSSVPEVDADLYRSHMNARSGQVYSASKVEKIIERMADALAKDGFVFVDVTPRVTKNDLDRTIDIAFDIIPAPKVFVERIDIEGNTRTLDRVIRRQFALVEGDALNPREVRRAEARIRGLGLFGRTAVNVRPGSAPDQVIIDVDVQEQPTGRLSFGVGYSTDGGFNGSISFSEANFRGRGQAIGLELGISEESEVLSFSFDEPGLLDRDLLVGIDAYYRRIDRTESSFQQTNIGFEPRAAFPISEDGRLQVAYKLTSDEIRDVDANASALILPRTDITSAIELTYTLDKRNSTTDPTSGFRLRLTQEFAGLGGDVEYSKTVARAKAYSSLFNEDLVLSAEFEGGLLAASGNSRITDRFFLGGNNLRGFETGGVGPRDFCLACGGAGGDVDDSLGGNTYAVARLEASFPLGLPEEFGIFGGFFYDIGTLYDLDNTAGSMGTVDDSLIWRSAAGVSLFWQTPIGPLRFNWAWPIEKESYDKTEDFRITLDTRF